MEAPSPAPIAHIIVNAEEIQEKYILNFKKEDEKSQILESSNVLYFKKVIKPTEEELKKHKEFLKKNLKKNFFS